MLKNLPDKNLTQTNEESGIREFLHSFIKELGDYLNNMKENTLVVDRIENNVAICENRETGKIQEISLEKLPKGICDGTVLTEKNGKYEVNLEKQEKIENRIEEKMKDIWQ